MTRFSARGTDYAAASDSTATREALDVLVVVVDLHRQARPERAAAGDHRRLDAMREQQRVAQPLRVIDARGARGGPATAP
jgi:hypothetical protein